MRRAHQAVGRHGVTCSGAESPQVNGQAGSDTINAIPSAIVPIFIDGGDPVGSSPGDPLNIFAGGGSVTYDAGPETCLRTSPY